MLVLAFPNKQMLQTSFAKYGTRQRARSQQTLAMSCLYTALLDILTDRTMWRA